jgi:Protein of unknown function (DUF3313)
MRSSATSLVRTLGACVMTGALLLTGCASTGGGGDIVASEATAANVARVGFLTNYARLRPMPGGGGMLCWRDAGVDWKRYDKVLIERIQVTLAPGSAEKPVDPTDLKTLLDYFHAALVKAIAPEAQVVNATGPGVLRVKIALTRLTPTNTLDSLAGTAVPYGFVAELGSGVATGRPAGATPYMGDTGMEVQFRDGVSASVIAECADNEIGRKYAADLSKSAPNVAETWVNGYLDSFTSWSYAQDAFNKWAAAFAQRFAELRGAGAKS